MNEFYAMYMRELKSYFDSSLAYLLIPIFLGLVGVFSLFFQDIFAMGLLDMRTVLFWMSLFLLLLIPAVTMRSFAEEKRTGSIEMLVTLPVSEDQMVLAKYAAAMSVVVLAIVLSVTYPISLSQLGDLDWGMVWAGYIGLICMSAAFTAIGIAMSTMTNSQVVAFLLSFAIGVLPFALGYTLHRVPVNLLPVVQYMTFEYHFSNLAKGILDSRSVVFYGSVVAVFLHVAVFRLEQSRLR